MELFSAQLGYGAGVQRNVRVRDLIAEAMRRNKVT